MVIVQDAYAGTESLAYADLVPPAATWPEKDGTTTNSERRISRVRAAIDPPGDARPDWRLAAGVATRLAQRIAPEKAVHFAYADESAVFAEHARTTAGRDLDYSALTYAILERDGPRQWPYRREAQGGTARLYADGRYATPSGRARFADVAYVPVAEPVCADYPLRLTTGRLRDHWHTMARTALSPALTRHVEEPWLSLHPADMAAAGLADGALARIRSRRGELQYRRARGRQPARRSRLPAHALGQRLHRRRRCERAHQPRPRSDIAPARTEAQRGRGGARRLALAGRGMDTRRRCAVAAQPGPWLRRFPYAAVLPTALGGGGARIALAAPQAPDLDTLEALCAALNVTRPHAAYDDPHRGIVRRVALADKAPAAFPAGRRHAHPGLLVGLGRRRRRARQSGAAADGPHRADRAGAYGLRLPRRDGPRHPRGNRGGTRPGGPAAHPALRDRLRILRAGSRAHGGAGGQSRQGA